MVIFRKICAAIRSPKKALRMLYGETTHYLDVAIHFYNRHVCNFVIGDVTFSFDTKDFYSKCWFFPRCDENHYHEPAVTSLVVMIMPHVPSFIDVGAHLGYFTILAGALSPEKPIIAYEMDDRSFSRLTRNIQLNNLKNVQAIHKAVSGSSGEAHYHRPILIDSGESLIPTGGITGTAIETRTLDDAIREAGLEPGLIKIDVEGAEYEVFSGMKETLSKNPILLLEIHGPKALKKFGTTSQEIIALLERNGYEVYEITDHRNSYRPNLKRLSSSTSSLSRNTMALVLKPEQYANLRSQVEL